MEQLVVAANEMHMAGVFHRDLKPDNILIEHDEDWPVPRVRIIDFGCSCFVTSGYHVYAGASNLPLKCGLHCRASQSAVIKKKTFFPHRNLLL